MSDSFWGIANTVDKMAHCLRDIGCVAERLYDDPSCENEDWNLLREILDELWIIMEVLDPLQEKQA